MEITPFENLKVTTITMIITLDAPINIGIAFHLLPVTKIQIKQTRLSSKINLPHCKTPGSIISMKYENMVRGVIKNNKRPFKNAVTIDISIIKKNINMKLSSMSLQMSGATSKEDGIEAATYLLNHIAHIQRMIDLTRSHPEETKQIVDWIKEHSKGEVIEKPNWEHRKSEGVTMNIYRPISVTSFVRPTESIPESFHPELSAFFMSLTDDFIYHSDLCQKLDFILRVPNVIDNPVSRDALSLKMVNYNYSLGFEVNRSNLNRYIKGKWGFVSRYNNALSNSVTIELPYTTEVDTTTKRRKNKIPHHTFLVYKSGSVTQSGPGGEIMRDAYELFMQIICELRPYIEYGRNIEEVVPVPLELEPVAIPDENSYIYGEMFG